MKMIKCLLLLAAVAIAFPAVAQDEKIDLAEATKATKATEVKVSSAELEKLMSDAGLKDTEFKDSGTPIQAVNKAKDVATYTGELNNYTYEVAASEPNKQGKFKVLRATLENDNGYMLAMEMLADGTVHKFCTGNDEICKSISNGVECGDTWPAWCYIPQDLLKDFVSPNVSFEAEEAVEAVEEVIYR